MKKISLKNKPTFIEVCAGAGGLSTGLIKAGFAPLLLNDNNSECCQTLKNNHPGANVVCCSMNNLGTHLDSFIGKVDVLTGGIPCQSFSQIGSRHGLDDPRGDLMFKFADMVDLLKPKIFMIENVKGLLSHDHGKTIQTIINNLNKHAQYHVQYTVLNASKFGVPQKRERVFIVGVQKQHNLNFTFPIEDEHVTILREALIDVPESDGAQYPDAKKKLFDMIPQGGCWVDLPIEIQKSYLGNSYLSGGGKRGILHRLSMDKPSLTLLCTPSQKQTERCHPTESRPLTIREYARIQTFSDQYMFTGSMASQYKQIGNAVPVELARRIGKSLYGALRM